MVVLFVRGLSTNPTIACIFFNLNRQKFKFLGQIEEESTGMTLRCSVTGRGA
jgi:hypothetical protein